MCEMIKITMEGGVFSFMYLKLGVSPGGGYRGRLGQSFCVGYKGRSLSHISHRKLKKKFFMDWTCLIERKVTCYVAVVLFLNLISHRSNEVWTMPYNRMFCWTSNLSRTQYWIAKSLMTNFTLSQCVFVISLYLIPNFSLIYVALLIV